MTGNRLIRYLCRRPCSCVLPVGWDRERGHYGHECPRHWFVEEILFHYIGIFQTTDGGYYRDGWVELRPWRWVSTLSLRFWPNTVLKHHPYPR